MSCAAFNAVVHEPQAAELRPLHTVREERRVCIEHPREEPVQSQLLVADVAIGESGSIAGNPPGAVESVSTLEPVTGAVALAEERRESYW